jgi:type IV secretory pathway TrbD component
MDRHVVEVTTGSSGVSGSFGGQSLMIRPGAKSLNKPQLICGIDRKLAGLAFLLAVILGANDGWPAKATAVALFVGLCAFGRYLTRTDPNAFQVFSRYLRQKGLHDPMKRELFQVRVEQGRR